jgi:hypothetical protein
METTALLTIKSIPKTPAQKKRLIAWLLKTAKTVEAMNNDSYATPFRFRLLK